MNSKRRSISRRDFLMRGTQATAGAMVTAFAACTTKQVVPLPKPMETMQLGLVTYLWGKDWNLPTLIRHCRQTDVLGVELRTKHAHGVEDHLTKRQRYEVRLRFENSPVTLVGLGTNFAFHHTDPKALKADIAGAKRYLQLSHDVGGSGVKVKPNALPEGVPVEQTIEQIGKSLNEIGRFGADLGQEVRVEVHGKLSQQLPHMKAIMDVADQPNVTVCWNCNPQDLEGQGLESNFKLVKDRFGRTVHIRELDSVDYPYQQLLRLLVNMDYKGWILLEARGERVDRIKAIAEQAALFDRMMAAARQRA